MPNWNWLTEPLVPQNPAIERLAQPGLEDSPGWAMAKGFGSGALEGLRQQTSPLNLGAAALSAVPMGAALRGLRGASQIGRGLAQVTPDLVEAAPMARQVMPAAEDVNALLGQMRYNMAKLPRPSAPPAVPPRMPAEFVPRGGEAAWNAPRPMPTPPPSPPGTLGWVERNIWNRPQ